MDFTYSRVPTQPFLDRDERPQEILTRKSGSHWLVVHHPVRWDQDIQWFWHKSENQLLVPLVPYYLPADPLLAFAFIAQLSFYLATQLPRGHTAQQLHLSLGDPVQQITDAQEAGLDPASLPGWAAQGQPMLRMFLGTAIRVTTAM